MFCTTEIRDQLSFEIDDLAEATAKDAFLHADLDRDGNLTLEEFRAWYQRNGMSDEVPGAVKPSKVSLTILRQLTNLSAYSVHEILEIFADVVNENGAIDRDTFETTIMRLAEDRERRDEAMTKKQRRFLGDCMHVLFETFDTDNNGTVDFVELASGLSILCNDSSMEKSAAAFSLYDYNGDGKISREEMTRHLYSIFKLMYASEHGVEGKMGEDCKGACGGYTTVRLHSSMRRNLTFSMASLARQHEIHNRVTSSKSTAEAMTLG